MTGLTRTDLPTSQKVQLAAAAVARQAEYGAKTELARRFDISRPTVYAAGATGSAVLEEHFRREETGTAGVWSFVDEAQLKRAVVALRVMAPSSLRPIEDLLPILYPGVSMSYGKVQQLAVEGEQQAAAFNARADLSAIHAGALDEMFSQGDPVLAGVDLDSGALFTLALRESRSGADWAEVLRTAKELQGLELEVVVKDAANGIAAGVSEVYPKAEQRDDCFHALYEMGKLRRRLEQRAYGAIAAEQEAEQKLEQVRRTGRGDRAKRGARLRQARCRCRPALELHDAFEQAMREAVEAMESVDLVTGRLRTASEMQAAIEAAANKMMALEHVDCSKVGRYIFNRAPGLAKYMDALNAELSQLAERSGERAVRLACIIHRLVHDLQNRRRPWHRHRDTRHLLGALAMLRDLVGDDAHVLHDAVDDIMQRRHRASSAVEGFNAALRPFLYVHKGVSSGFLELFRAYYNLRTRRWGRHQGTSAHECLTGQRITDWLTELGFPPSSALS